MLVKDLLEKLKNVPEDAEITLNYVYSTNEIWNVSCTEDAAEAVYDKYTNTVDLCTKDYK